MSAVIEEVNSRDWAEKVYKADIQDKRNTLYKEPGYTLEHL